MAEAGRPTVANMIDVQLELSDKILNEKSPMAMWWWFGWSVLHKCPGITMWNSARGMVAIAKMLVVVMVGYDVSTQDFLFGNAVLDLTVIASFFLFASYIIHVTEQPFRHGFLIVDPQSHWTVFMFFLLNIVLAVCLTVVTTHPGAIALAPGVSNPFPGTAVHEGIYIVALVHFWLITIHGFIFLFAMMGYWGTQSTAERTYAFVQYAKYYHGEHKHWSGAAIVVPAGYMLTGNTPFVSTSAKSQAYPLLPQFPNNSVMDIAQLQKLNTITTQNAQLQQQFNALTKPQQSVGTTGFAS